MGVVPASAEVISLSEERASIRRRLLQRSAREVAEKAFARAGDYDEDGAYPAADVAALHDSGLLAAVLPVKCGPWLQAQPRAVSTPSRNARQPARSELSRRSPTIF